MFIFIQVFERLGMYLTVGKKILQSVSRAMPYNLKGVQKFENPKFSFSNPYILEGCDDVVLSASEKTKRYLESKPLSEATGVLDEISAKTGIFGDIFNALKSKLPEKELSAYLENNNLKELYNEFSKNGEKGLFSKFLNKSTESAASGVESLQKENKILNSWKNSIIQKLSNTKNAFTKEELNLLCKKAFGGVKVPYGVNDDAFVYLNGLNPEKACHFDAHGLAKGGVSNQLEQLNNLLSKGINKNKEFYTAPLAVKDSAGIGAGLGTAGGHAYRDGSFILVSGKNKSLKADGIEYVIVNDAYYKIFDDLAKKFPNQKFIRADEAVNFFNSL